MKNLKIAIESLAKEYANRLERQIAQRVLDMKSDDKSHYLIYQVLGISDEEGNMVDVYQNKGRFLYKYAGSFLEEASLLCFEFRYPNAQRKIRIENKQGQRPKTFEIDCLIEQDAYEIKWRDATTDGDHITKEHTRLKSVKAAGYNPIRLMFFYPNRMQAIRVQQTLETIYKGVGGAYFYGPNAWKHLEELTKVDLHAILVSIAKESLKTGVSQ
jgi:hypothetical protein